MKNVYEILFYDICVEELQLILSYKGKVNYYPWLESYNKHYPDVLNLKVDYYKKTVSLDYKTVYDFITICKEHRVKLSMSTSYVRVSYRISTIVKNISWHNILIEFSQDSIVMSISNTKKNRVCNDDYLECIAHDNKKVLYDVSRLPIQTLCIGSCFSRSIFKSEPYFNPNYKKYFDIKSTLFHNSFISLFSEKLKFDYLSIEDLMIGDARRYAGIEFTKDIINILNHNKFDLIIIDNYINATCPVVKIDNNSYITYNKYISESIFKRLLSSCEVVYPGSPEYMRLYRNSIRSLRHLLKLYKIENVVLIGGRLCKRKIDELTGRVDLWDDKMDWIIEVNKNWNKVDKVFLEEMKEAFFIDKSKTRWYSDLQSPLIGGASPSHYQSGYYKELYKDLLAFVSEDLSNI